MKMTTTERVELDDKRMGEIAYLTLKHFLKAKGVTLSQNSGRELGDIAKQTGVPLAELRVFAWRLMRELVDEIHHRDI